MMNLRRLDSREAVHLEPVGEAQGDFADYSLPTPIPSSRRRPLNNEQERQNLQLRQELNAQQRERLRLVDLLSESELQRNQLDAHNIELMRSNLDACEQLERCARERSEMEAVLAHARAEARLAAERCQELEQALRRERGRAGELQQTLEAAAQLCKKAVNENQIGPDEIPDLMFP